MRTRLLSCLAMLSIVATSFQNCGQTTPITTGSSSDEQILSSSPNTSDDDDAVNMFDFSSAAAQGLSQSEQVQMLLQQIQNFLESPESEEGSLSILSIINLFLRSNIPADEVAQIVPDSVCPRVQTYLPYTNYIQSLNGLLSSQGQTLFNQLLTICE